MLRKKYKSKSKKNKKYKKKSTKVKTKKTKKKNIIFIQCRNPKFFLYRFSTETVTNKLNKKL